MREAFILAIIRQALTLFSRLMENSWTPGTREECVELIELVARLKMELISIVGPEKANKLVSEAYNSVSPRYPSSST